MLLPDGLEAHFSGHRPRNFVTSVAAAIGFSRDERAYLGRWSMGMVASEEYVRTSKQVVFKIQKAVPSSRDERRSTLRTKRCRGFVTRLRPQVQIPTGSRNATH